jgi:D-amino-acid oxidase
LNITFSDDKNGEVIILGSGVSGLTCGIRLLEKGFGVQIVAHCVPPHTTSDIAPAYWSPFRVYPEGRVLKWGKYSYKEFLNLSTKAGTGVSLIQLMELYDHEVANPWWERAVPECVRASRDEVAPGFKDAYLVEVPLIETPIYMKYLVKRFNEMGGKIMKLDVKLSFLEELYGEDRIIVNCSGLGAYDVCGDKNTFPIRGQIIRTTNPGINRCYHYESERHGITYIVPRTGDCILGGTAEEYDWNTEIDMATANQIFEKCRALEPSLDDAKVLEHRVGLRPGRTEVCLELERVSERSAVIHNYGHGGAGFTLSWGCAEEVARLVEQFVTEEIK